MTGEEEEEKLAADLSTAAVSSMSANRCTRSRRPFGPEAEEEEKSTNPSAYPTDDVDPGTELDRGISTSTAGEKKIGLSDLVGKFFSFFFFGKIAAAANVS